MKKVLFIAHWFPNKRNGHKGIFIKNHAKSINEVAEVQVLDFSIEYSKHLYKKKCFKSNEAGLNILHLHVYSRFYKFLYYSIFFQYYLLKKLLKSEDLKVNEYDFIVSNVIFPSGILSWMLAKKNSIKLIHIEHWSYFSTFLKKDFHKRKALKALNYSSKIIVVSNFLKHIVSDYVEKEKIKVIPNVVSSNFFYAEKTDAEINEYRFLAIANWNKPKDPFTFTQALSNIALKMKVNIRLTIIGDGKQLSVLKRNDYSIKIDYVGAIANDALNNYFCETDYFIHGSDFETFSIVPVEALLTGTPVIGNKVGVLPDIINDQNGVLCDNDVLSWEEAIITLLNRNYNNKKISEKIKGKYSIDEISKLFSEVFV